MSNCHIDQLIGRIKSIIARMYQVCNHTVFMIILTIILILINVEINLDYHNHMVIMVGSLTFITHNWTGGRNYTTTTTVRLASTVTL
ncbi:hypothetical protein LSH36_122g09016 [Paralvinella palmiformis]|uniref:Uncharacterized protein n=1 Tax=Paralvinella palmiformis TaxID=53620 RepID=A0AAD9JXB1_9ANNE|nr:hypothetical protein LSH36_122g09016 [Paralvinella palmiformis]